MNQANIVVTLDPTRLNRPLPLWYARQVHSFVARFRNIPDDVTNVMVRVFKPDGVSYFDIPVNRSAESSEGIAYVWPMVFETAGESKYEVHAYDYKGNPTALGKGHVEIETFSASGEPLPPGQPVTIMRIADASGAFHNIIAVPDGEGGFTSQVE